MLTAIILLVILALVFDFINGFHDSANSIATIIATNVLKPWQALLWAAGFNFLAFFIFPLNVAATIGGGIIHSIFISNESMAAALLGAIIFNLSTWALRLPSSSSHALIGGLMGVGLMQGGMDALYWSTLLIIFASVFIAPLIGMCIAFILVKIIPRIKSYKPGEKFYSVLQLCSSALLSMGHGGNDAQKTMGVIVALLFANGYLDSIAHTPFWVIMSCYTVIALGTASGGWRIIHTVAYKITKLKPPSGACAEFGAAFALFTANQAGIPLSTTHVLTGGVIGVSSYNRDSMKKTNWQIIRHIFIAWIITFPCAALFASGIFWIIK